MVGMRAEMRVPPPTGLKTVAAIYTDYGSDYHRYDDSIPSYGEDFPRS